jgi:hypothetical protein
MTSRRHFITHAILIVAGVALLLVFVFVCQSGVRVCSRQQGLEIDRARYFSGGRFDCAFSPTIETLRLQWRVALAKFGVPFVPVKGINVHGEGPALLIHGRILQGSSPRVDFVTSTGQLLAPMTYLEDDSKNGTFVWYLDLSDTCGLANGFYHIRKYGNTNILADARVRM